MRCMPAVEPGAAAPPLAHKRPPKLRKAPFYTGSRHFTRQRSRRATYDGSYGQSCGVCRSTEAKKIIFVDALGNPVSHATLTWITGDRTIQGFEKGPARDRRRCRSGSHGSACLSPRPPPRRAPRASRWETSPLWRARRRMIARHELPGPPRRWSPLCGTCWSLATSHSSNTPTLRCYRLTYSGRCAPRSIEIICHRLSDNRPSFCHVC